MNDPSEKRNDKYRKKLDNNLEPVAFAEFTTNNNTLIETKEGIDKKKWLTQRRSSERAYGETEDNRGGSIAHWIITFRKTNF